jgi:tRNA (guanine37-N1)-methyltransferase
MVKLESKMANTMSMYENIIILCGHYKGVDQRVRDILTKEISIGYVYQEEWEL